MELENIAANTRSDMSAVKKSVIVDTSWRRAFFFWRSPLLLLLS